MATVIYGAFQVSNATLRATLQTIANVLKRSVKLTSGDRTSVAPGGAKGSLHLSGNAADFHVVGLSDSDAFRALRTNRKAIFGDARGLGFRFQILMHGPYTKTDKPHIHLGASPLTFLGKRGFVVEGTYLGQGYTTVEAP